MTSATPDDVRHWLGQLPELCALLPDAAVARGAIDGPRPAPASKPPLKLHILHLLDRREKANWEFGMWQVDPDRQGILPYLWGWVRDLEATLYEESARLPDETPTDPTVAGCCDWLVRHLGMAEALDQWPEFADGIRVIRGHLLAATSGVRDLYDKPVPCSRCGNPLQRVDERPLWECSACGHEVTVQAVTLNQAAKIMGVPKDKLYTIANRPALLADIGAQPLRPVLGETGSRKLYDLNDLRRVVAEINMRRMA